MHKFSWGSRQHHSYLTETVFARPLFLSWRTEEQAMMKSEGTSSQCSHLSHPLTSLNKKFMCVLKMETKKKLVTCSLTSRFPAVTVRVLVWSYSMLMRCCPRAARMSIKLTSRSSTGALSVFFCITGSAISRCGLTPSSKVLWCPLRACEWRTPPSCLGLD